MVTPSSSDPKHPRLLSFTLDGWDVLGDRVSVTLSDGVAVLVGRNGAGKSAILEGFKKISLYAIEVSGLFVHQSNYGESFPRILEIDILTPTNRKLNYKYELLVAENEDILDSIIYEERPFSWNDSCHYLDGQKEPVWTTLSGITTLSDRESSTILGITSSVRQFNFPKQPQVDLPSEMEWIYSVLKGINLIRTNSSRGDAGRSFSSVRISKKNVYFSPLNFSEVLSYKIIQMNPEVVKELSGICERVGLGKEIFIQKNDSGRGVESEFTSSISLDRVNIGLLSDGALRVLSILIGLIDSHLSKTTIIEEPESQIHPAMIEKILNEIEAYTYGDNLLLSTHSLQVVAWTSPGKLNLVHRTDGKTIVRKLKEDEIQNVVNFLSEEGSLGEWLYSGIVDE